MRLAMLRAQAIGTILLAAVPAALDNAAAQTVSLQANDAATTTPIKHVIVIIGENRTFDHVFATYEPRPGQTVDNLLSEGHRREDGTPGPQLRRGRAAHGRRRGPDDSSPAPPKTNLPPA